MNADRAFAVLFGAAVGLGGGWAIVLWMIAMGWWL